MSFVAEASQKLAVRPEVAFDRLANHASWDKWMPASFCPVGISQGVLRVGDKLRVRIAGAPMATTIEVSVFRRPHEIAWRGGLRGVLVGEHHFLFEPEGPDGTWVRSVETWRGAMTPLVRRFVKPAAERIGAAQLAGLARGVAIPVR